MSPAQRRDIHANGLRFHLLDWGTEGQPPLFLIHGLGSTLHMFDLIAPELSQRFHVFAVDQRGHGLSDKPDDGYDFETLSRDLDTLIEALGFGDTPVPLVGHSWGAYTVLYYAATRPERVSKLVLLDGGIRPLSEVFPEGETRLYPPIYTRMNLEAIRRFIREEWIGAALRPDFEPLALSIYDQSNPDDIQPHLRRAHNIQIARHLWAFQPGNFFPRVQCPTLIVNAINPGETLSNDLRRYTEAAQIAAPQAQVIWMDDTIHDIPWQRPAELVAVLNRFL
ncbi:MAG: alpha/beta hydrolase [Anaerolineae bacterium]